MACNTCGARRGHMGGCPEGQATGGANKKKGRRATSGTCGCGCGHLKGEVINGVTQRWGGGCTGARAGDPHAAHCGRVRNGCPY